MTDTHDDRTIARRRAMRDRTLRVVEQILKRWYFVVPGLVSAIAGMLWLVARNRVLHLATSFVHGIQVDLASPAQRGSALVRTGLVITVLMILTVFAARGWKWGQQLVEQERKRAAQDWETALKAAAREGGYEGGIEGGTAGNRRVVDEVLASGKIGSLAAPLTAAQNFGADRLKLGDDDAADFPYIKEPLLDTWNACVEQLRTLARMPEMHASQLASESSKRGVLLVGEANAGKTRLAYEALRATLSDWVILQWNETYSVDKIPHQDALAGKHIVVLVEDLQNYVTLPTVTASPIALSSFSERAPILSNRGETLHTLLTEVRAATPFAIVFATCRAEDFSATGAALDWLLSQLAKIVVPSFSKEHASAEATRIFELFRVKAREHRFYLHESDWDGTIGSLVLGLSGRASMYGTMVSSGDPSIWILRAMKLLTIAGTPDHTEDRLRLVCSDVFEMPELGRPGRPWDVAISRLFERNLIAQAAPATQRGQDDNEEVSEPVAFVIRKDSYFDAVIQDYPDRNLPQQLQHHFSLLHQALRRGRDSVGLYNLGVVLLERNQIAAAQEAFDDAVKISGGDFAALYNHGVTLYLRGRFEEAYDRFKQAAEVRAGGEEPAAAALIYLGMTADALSRQARVRGHYEPATSWQEQALDHYEQATEQEQENSLAWINYAIALEQRREYVLARDAYQHALDLDDLNPDWHTRFAVLLNKLGSNGEAAFHEAFARALRDVGEQTDGLVKNSSEVTRSEVQEAIVRSYALYQRDMAYLRER